MGGGVLCLLVVLGDIVMGGSGQVGLQPEAHLHFSSVLSDKPNT